MISEQPTRTEAKATLMACSDEPVVGEFYLIVNHLWKVHEWDCSRRLFSLVDRDNSTYWVNYNGQWQQMIDANQVVFVGVEIDDYGLHIGDIDDSRAWDEAGAKACLLRLLLPATARR